jgi:hypothetical protein
MSRRASLEPPYGLPPGGDWETVTIGTSAALLEQASPVAGRKYLVVNPVDGALYIGATNGVTTSSGGKVASGSWLHLDGTGTWYGIAEGNVDVRVYAV